MLKRFFSIIVFLFFICDSSYLLADRLNFGPMFQVGLPMNDALSVTSVTEETNRGRFSPEEIKVAKELCEKYLINTAKAHFAFGVKVGYEFGQDYNERFGIDFELSYLLQRNALWNTKIGKVNELGHRHTIVDWNDRRSEAIMRNIYNTVDLEHVVNVHAINIYFGGRYYPFKVDSATIFVNLGLDMKLNFNLNFTRKIQDLDRDLLEERFNLAKKQIKVSKDEKDKVSKELRKFNLAPRVGLGFQFFDRVVGINIFIRYWMMEDWSIKRGDSGEFGEALGNVIGDENRSPIDAMKLNRLFDLYTSVEIDLMPLFRVNNSPDI